MLRSFISWKPYCSIGPSRSLSIFLVDVDAVFVVDPEYVLVVGTVVDAA